MRDRGIEATVFPFSFREHLRHRAAEPEKPPDRIAKDRAFGDREALPNTFRGADSRKRRGPQPGTGTTLLRTFVDTALLRDARAVRGIAPAATALAHHAPAGQCRGLFSVNKFCNAVVHMPDAAYPRANSAPCHGLSNSHTRPVGRVASSWHEHSTRVILSL
jgi:uncharacterized protein